MSSKLLFKSLPFIKKSNYSTAWVLNFISRFFFALTYISINILNSVIDINNYGLKNLYNYTI